jgi:hypothetical protein
MNLFESAAIRQRIVREGIKALERDLAYCYIRGIKLTSAQLFALAQHRAEQSLTVIEAEVDLGICPEMNQMEGGQQP